MAIGTNKTANLASVSLAGLLAHDANAINDLVSECKTNGFFYLDFRHPSTSDILKLVEQLSIIGKSMFKMTLEEKEEYSTEKYLPSRLLGYKRAGCSVGPFSGKKDGYESFSIHNNGMFGDDAMIVPQDIDDNLELFKMFMSEVHEYTDCILSILSEALQLPYDLKQCHRKDKPSSANMAMLNYLPWGSSDERIGNMAHTDMGTLTVVFSKSEGLQAMLPGREDWSFIPPQEGHAVVNVGDSLRFLSNGMLASSLHRVVPPPDSAGQDKFSVIYFLRPEFDAKFKNHEGKEINSVEWHNKKYSLFREDSLDAKEHGAMLTGRNEYLGATAST
ncbi:hypothetical protein FPRO06_07726 [Fusarium proliferatum]|uniref:Related to naringenin,2-oxoglutarate 3-dioxygenase n=2 Tax=Gibberella intermedia TaxID=948311 RepID=A0A1L7WA46_FUSPR|nr:uncharacterized protein FPRO_08805 [Fusarium proliferatum ET1]KAG4283347.1 hypothetical protein FPRO06_07726 [Fusarium proliferatum]RKL38009.1 hypothetical protein BFJ72_g7471 [Fusarium proliferatum]CVK98796.1 related to naringenin,2-oxoglutarate 3-dioxygenase [Fusarium proliferatum]CZR49454.1 related to naringenin,2-oxoglutarate 3-dioxygenase [Fusarium proliferatum ET1]